MNASLTDWVRGWSPLTPKRPDYRFVSSKVGKPLSRIKRLLGKLYSIKQSPVTAGNFHMLVISD